MAACVGLAALASSLHADAISELNLAVGSSLTYDSNVRMRKDGASDEYLAVNADGSYMHRFYGANATVNVGVRHREYNKSSDLSGTDVNFGFNFAPSISRDGETWAYHLNTIFTRQQEEDLAAHRQVQTTTYGLAGDLRYTMNRHWSTSYNASWRRTKSGGNLLDRDAEAAGATLYYTRDRKKSFFGTLSASKVDAVGNSDARSSKTYTGSLGIDGQVSAKIRGTASGGIQFSDSAGNTSTVPYYSLSLVYTYDTTTSFSLTGSNSVMDSSVDTATTVTSVALGMTRKLNSSMNGTLGVSYSSRDYGGSATSINGVGGTSDSTWNLNASLTHQLSSWGTLALAYRYQLNDAAISQLQYDRHFVTLSLQVPLL